MLTGWATCDGAARSAVLAGAEEPEVGPRPGQRDGLATGDHVVRGLRRGRGPGEPGAADRDLPAGGERSRRAPPTADWMRQNRASQYDSVSGCRRGSDGVLMEILNQVVGWVLIVLAVATASGPLRQLVRANRRGARFSAIADLVGSRLLQSLAWLAFGVNAVLGTHPAWLGWILFPVAIAGVAYLAVPGIMSRRRASVSWWRFWVRVIPPPSAAELTGLGDANLLPGDAGTLDPKTAIMLDARILGLIEQIKNAQFSTTRFSTGYDEEEVDIFLDKLIAILSESGRPDQGELRNAQFSATWLRPGYGRQDVDSLLREIAQATVS
jgi:DivIVA domain-containing protein